MVRRQPAASVVACADPEVALRLRAACHTPYFRPCTSTAVTGCELGGAAENVIAPAVGTADRHGLGDNTKAAHITRGLTETKGCRQPPCRRRAAGATASTDPPVRSVGQRRVRLDPPALLPRHRCQRGRPGHHRGPTRSTPCDGLYAYTPEQCVILL
ncbi:hypothetical protein KQY30_35415 [Streptomyces sp. GMY02]|nr:hypothetical protein KQY30_35415 [Streptomyces sp. GMY02]